jgi:hypothetical protein
LRREQFLRSAGFSGATLALMPKKKHRIFFQTIQILDKNKRIAYTHSNNLLADPYIDMELKNDLYNL